MAKAVKKTASDKGSSSALEKVGAEAKKKKGQLRIPGVQKMEGKEGVDLSRRALTYLRGWAHHGNGRSARSVEARAVLGAYVKKGIITQQQADRPLVGSSAATKAKNKKAKAAAKKTKKTKKRKPRTKKK